MFCDVHSHVIWGVDDGAAAFERAQQLLRECEKDGIDTIITTPHVTPGRQPFPEERYLRHFEDTQRWLSDNGIAIRLYRGAEILYTSSYTGRFLQERRLRGLAELPYILMEFMPGDPLERIRKALMEIGCAGYTPVIAHIERYACLKKTETAAELKAEFGALIQVNAHTVTEKPPFFRKKFIRGLFEEELVDFVGTDTHDMDSRHPNMTAAYEKLSDWLGEDKARALTGGNIRAILEKG